MACSFCQATSSVQYLGAKNQPQRILLATRSLFRNEQLLRNTLQDLILTVFQAIPSAVLALHYPSFSIQIILQITSTIWVYSSRLLSNKSSVISCTVLEKQISRALTPFTPPLKKHPLRFCCLAALTLLEQKARSTSHDDHLNFTAYTE